MGRNIFSAISTLINRVVDIVIQGNLERVTVMLEFNKVFKDAFYSQEFNRLCSVTTSKGNPSFKHELSSFYLRSGFKITIMNDDNLKESDYSFIASYVIQSKEFVRQLMALGYDTLIIRGKNSYTGMQIPLKEIADLKGYMLG